MPVNLQNDFVSSTIKLFLLCIILFLLCVTFFQCISTIRVLVMGGFGKFLSTITSLPPLLLLELVLLCVVSLNFSLALNTPGLTTFYGLLDLTVGKSRLHVFRPTV